VLTFAREQGFGVCGLIRSPLQGPKGNIEFLAGLRFLEEQRSSLNEMMDILF
jgi:predicted rRNA methylase YqxC with S4 and FtsJ domains